jgi:DNA-binding NarL/FixJ family response regulator
VVAPEFGQIIVHVVEDHPLYRAALGEAIDATPGLRLGVGAQSVEEFATTLPRSAAAQAGSVVTLDLRLPGVSGAEAVSRVVRLGFRVLVVSAYGERVEVRAALAAGAHGYLTKDAGIHEIRRAIRVVADGGRYLPARLAALLRETRVAPAEPRLSDRERQVLARVAFGDRDQDIASALSISVRTVRSHLDRIREKTGCRRRPDLTRLAIESGIGREDARL